MTQPSHEPGVIKTIFHILRLFWLVAFGLTLALLFGLLAGWSTTREFSDGVFLAGIALMIVSGGSMMGSPLDTSGPLWMRYFTAGRTGETRQQYFSDFLEKQTFGMQAFVGGIFTMLIAVGVSLF